MNHSSIENVKPEPQLNNEPQPMVSTSPPAIGNTNVSCCLISCGTVVKPKLLNIEAMVTCQSLRFDKVQYEISYFLNGEQKVIWMNENEFDVINGNRQIIGFVKNSS